MITDETELASLGLPNVITDDMMGAVFATADDQVTLYAYPAYGCRAILIAGKDDAYSFCVLDGFTDNTVGANAGYHPPHVCHLCCVKYYFRADHQC